MTRVRVHHAGETHELALWSHGLCVDCRYLDASLRRCRLFGVTAGARPAVCIAAEGEQRTRDRERQS